MKIVKTIRNQALTIFGDIKVFKYPLFILYDPGSYLVKGDEMREVIKVIQDGDILIRGYKNYLDGYFIPGFFSHAGIYLGQVTEEKVLEYNPEVKRTSIKEGEQIVIHSMANGVFMEDLLNFCRCDYMVILRRNFMVESTSSQVLTHEDVFKTAVNFLDTPYDFGFNFSDIKALSCTELVFQCYLKILAEYDVTLKTRQVLFLRRKMIIPDDFITDKFNLVWKSRSIKDNKLDSIMNKNNPSKKYA